MVERIRGDSENLFNVELVIFSECLSVEWILQAAKRKALKVLKISQTGVFKVKRRTPRLLFISHSPQTSTGSVILSQSHTLQYPDCVAQ